MWTSVFGLLLCTVALSISCTDDESADAWVSQLSCKQLKEINWCVDKTYGKQTQERCPVTCKKSECAPVLCTDDESADAWVSQLSCKQLKEINWCVDKTYGKQTQERCPVTCEKSECAAAAHTTECEVGPRNSRKCTCGNEVCPADKFCYIESEPIYVRSVRNPTFNRNDRRSLSANLGCHDGPKSQCIEDYDIEISEECQCGRSACSPGKFCYDGGCHKRPKNFACTEDNNIAVSEQCLCGSSACSPGRYCYDGGCHKDPKAPAVYTGKNTIFSKFRLYVHKKTDFGVKYPYWCINELILFDAKNHRFMINARTPKKAGNGGGPYSMKDLTFGTASAGPNQRKDVGLLGFNEAARSKKKIPRTNGGHYCSDIEKWLEFDFGTPTELGLYAIRMYVNNLGIKFAPTDWTFEGSDDGVTWTILDTQTGITDWEGALWNVKSEVKRFKIGEQKNYRNAILNQQCSAKQSGSSAAKTVDECMARCSNDGSCKAITYGDLDGNDARHCVLCSSTTHSASVNWNTYLKTITGKYGTYSKYRLDVSAVAGEAMNPPNDPKAFALRDIVFYGANGKRLFKPVGSDSDGKRDVETLSHASSEYLTATAYKALTRDTFYSNMGWWQYDFQTPTEVSAYELERHHRNCYPVFPAGGSTTGNTMSPMDWTFQGSNDGVTWTILDTRKGVDYWYCGEVKRFDLEELPEGSVGESDLISNSLNTGILLIFVLLSAALGFYFGRGKDKKYEVLAGDKEKEIELTYQTN